MISNDLIKQKVLDFAFSGKMVDNVISDEYYLDISDSYEKFNGGNRVKYEDSIEEFKYELPSNWKWVRLEDVCDTFGRIGFRGYTKSDLVDTKNDGAISLSPSNIINGKLDYNSCTYITWDKYNESPEIKVKNGDIVLVKTASVGKNALVENLPHESTINPQFALLKNIRIVNKYLYYYLNTTIAKKHYDKFSIGTSVPTFSQGKINSILIPLCPLKEQKMIVEKLDEIYNLIEIKENNDQEKDKLKRILKEKILSNAFCVALINNNNSLDSVDNEEFKGEKLFEIPSNWKWCEFKSIGESGIGLTYKPENISEDGMIVLRSSNIQNGKLDLKDIVRVNCKVNDNIIVKDNDILVCARNGSKRLVGKTCLLENMKEKMTYGAFMTIFRTPYYKYVYWFMQSKYYYNQLYENTNTMTINQITQKKLNSLIIPLPPLEEQKRIVEKIESLFELIEQL